MCIRDRMILCSLVVWSVVTWWTGHAEDYTSLLIARGAMGISEAFYLTAALALITDYHRGSTRSISTGLHMSGIYVGMAVAGFGADVYKRQVNHQLRPEAEEEEMFVLRYAASLGIPCVRERVNVRSMAHTLSLIHIS